MYCPTQGSRDGPSTQLTECGTQCQSLHCPHEFRAQTSIKRVKARSCVVSLFKAAQMALTLQVNSGALTRGALTRVCCILTPHLGIAWRSRSEGEAKRSGPCSPMLLPADIGRPSRATAAAKACCWADRGLCKACNTQ
eukprot:scaffold24715_cov19-Tisochrysis_lutea.AAC.5